MNAASAFDLRELEKIDFRIRNYLTERMREFVRKCSCGLTHELVFTDERSGDVFVYSVENISEVSKTRFREHDGNRVRVFVQDTRRCLDAKMVEDLATMAQILRGL